MILGYGASYIEYLIGDEFCFIIKCSQQMRIFISSIDDGGARRNRRVFLDSCNNTSQLIKEICRELGVGRSYVIIKLKYEPHNLILVENWPISHYPIKNGATFIVEFNTKYSLQQATISSTQPLSKVQEEDEYASESHSSSRLSFLSCEDNENDSRLLEESLNRLIEAVREGKLEKIAEILKEEPSIEDEAQLSKAIQRRYQYLLNEVGDAGKNSLHCAIEAKNLEIVSFLIIKGANPTLTTVDEYTPLQLAVLSSSPSILSLLLEQKRIDINQVTAQGTALHLAAQKEDFKCIELLFHNEVDSQTLDNLGKRAIDVASNQGIKQLLQKKSEVRRMDKPNISKGDIYRVTSMTYRLKQRHLVINPFKDEVTVMNTSNEIQEKFEISLIDSLEEVEERSWLMSGSIFYFNIVLKDKEKRELLFGVKHENIYNKWISNFRIAIKYRMNSMYTRPVPSNEQLIQLINDEADSITLHKRRVEHPASNRKMISILNLCPDDQQLENQERIRYRLSLRKSDSRFVHITENSVSNESQIVLGSIIKGEQSTKSDNHSEYASIVESPVEPSFVEKEIAKSNFRKNSGSKFQYSVSQFKSQQAKSSISFRDFQIIKLLGNGSFGIVYSAKHKLTGKVYALKILNKKKLISKKQLKYAVGQANILKKVDFPFVIKLHYAFQTPLSLYMALDNCTNGDLSELIIVKERLTESTARFIIAQIILALEYLHNNNILYRDLKPENILIASDGFVRLTDFGLSKQNNFSMSFCGSPAYLSPEMLQKKGVGFSTDIYGIGCVLFEMVVGDPPFFDEKLDTLYENIKSGKLRYPSYLSIEVKSLISKLLERDITKRIGVKDFNDIKSHDFFKKMDWKMLLSRKITPPSEMFLNDQDVLPYHEVQLEKPSEITLNDTDYDQTTQKISRIKHFTFIREGAPFSKRKEHLEV